MTGYRDDDIEALITRVEKERTGSKRAPKIMQTWLGLVAVEVLTDDTDDLLDVIVNKSSALWRISHLARGNGWVSFFGSYTAKGANADDAESLVRRLADKNGFEVGEVAVRTRPPVIPAAR